MGRDLKGFFWVDSRSGILGVLVIGEINGEFRDWRSPSFVLLNPSLLELGSRWKVINMIHGPRRFGSISCWEFYLIASVHSECVFLCPREVFSCLVYC